MKASDVLRRAGDISRERGWRSGGLTNVAGQVCAIGSLQLAEHGEFKAAGDTLLEALRAPLGPEVSIAIWNDEPGRTHAEVLIALDAAYVLALQSEGIEPEDVL